MRKLIIISLTLMFSLLPISCKRYKNDKFFSTYTVKKRITKTWNCVSYKNPEGVDFSLPSNHFVLDFAEQATSKFLDGEITKSTPWYFEDNKNYLNCFGKWKILSLMVNKLEIESEEGAVYTFVPQKEDSIENISDGIKNVPLFGIFEEPCKLVDYNKCETANSINAFMGSNSMFIGPGLLGYGIIGNFPLNYANITFNHNFTKKGYVSFYYKAGKSSSSWTPTFKVNNNIISPSFFSEGVLDANDSFIWIYTIIPVNSAGSTTIQILSNNSFNNVYGIDEIRFWEVN